MSLTFAQAPSDISTIESDFSDSGLATAKKYNRISTETRDSLLSKIFFENKKIKIAAKELNMNYSTAKTILHLYRKKQKKSGKKIKEENRCRFRAVIGPVNSGIEIMVSQGGKQIPKPHHLSKVHEPLPIEVKPIAKKPLDDLSFYHYQIRMAICQQMRRNLQKVALSRPNKAVIRPNVINKTGISEQNALPNVKRNVIVIKPVKDDTTTNF